MLTHCTFSLQTAVAVQGWGFYGIYCTPSPTVHPLGWYKVGRSHRALYQGPPSFQGDKHAWNMCPGQSVRCTLVIPNRAPCSMLFWKRFPQKHWNEGKDPATTDIDESALLDTKKLDRKFDFFFSSNHKNIPRKSLSYIQIKA